MYLGAEGSIPVPSPDKLGTTSTLAPPALKSEFVAHWSTIAPRMVKHSRLRGTRAISGRNHPITQPRRGSDHTHSSRSGSGGRKYGGVSLLHALSIARWQCVGTRSGCGGSVMLKHCTWVVVRLEGAVTLLSREIIAGWCIGRWRTKEAARASVWRRITDRDLEWRIAIGRRICNTRLHLLTLKECLMCKKDGVIPRLASVFMPCRIEIRRLGRLVLNRPSHSEEHVCDTSYLSSVT